MNCECCKGTGWVCEWHTDKAWEHPEGCDCGAGAPCPDCNPLHRAEEPEASHYEGDFGCLKPRSPD